MHKSTFHTDVGDVLLLPTWILHGKKETYLACLLIVVLGIAYQGIKFARQQYGRKCRNLKCKRYIMSRGHMLQTLLYILQFGGGYVLMLSAMTYNVWLLVAVIAGFGLGYFFFGWGEYEETAGFITVPAAAVCHRATLSGANLTGRSYVQDCASGLMGLKVSSSSVSGTQELLPFNRFGEEEEDGEPFPLSANASCGGCDCGTSKV
ncbi:high affinity copper uptake protein 1 [Plakobranchus ocellatus]|uniref:Copper transport protein n=1 Tax=Plakobranchus ocellatus TaxID=259542 RepID=A0AAV3ZCY6_9GAST|nr:high affinity copper uptake protein 1 [Plakobranchus ocellatus]